MTLPRDAADDLDRLLDDGAGELGSLYRRLPKVDPPKRLDRAVLGEAARAVRGRPPRRHGWMVGVGSAAGVVLAAGIAWQIGRNVAQQQSSHDAFRSAPGVVPVEPITEPSVRRHDRANETQGMVAPQAPAPAAASPAQALAKQAPARKPEPRPALPAPAKSAPPPGTMKAVAPPPAPAPVEAPAPFETTGRADRAESENAIGGAAAANAPADRLKKESRQELDSVDDKATTTLRDAARSRAASAPSSSVELRRDMQLSADDWIAHIRELIRQGRRQQAIESLRLLRQMHPDVEIPAKVRAIED